MPRSIEFDREELLIIEKLLDKELQKKYDKAMNRLWKKINDEYDLMED